MWIFDYKPEIVAQHGKPVPEDYFKGKRFSTMTGDPTGKVMLQPVEPFKQGDKVACKNSCRIQQPSPMTCAS